MSDDTTRRMVEAFCASLDEPPNGVDWVLMDSLAATLRRVAWDPHNAPVLAAAFRAAIAAMQPAPPTLPLAPPEGCVRVEVKVWVARDENEETYACVAGSAEEIMADGPPDAVLVADVKPLTPPVVVASVEGEG